MRSLLLFVPAALANPIILKRYDLDHNGIPDLCYESNDGYAHCQLANGAWTQIPSTQTTKASQPTTLSTSSRTSSLVSATLTKNANTTPTSTATAKAFPTDAVTFESQKGSKWTLDTMSGTNTTQALGEGAIFFNDIFQGGCDKGCTSAIGGTAFWNFGDCEGYKGFNSPNVGFSMGSAWYGSLSNPLEIDSKGITGFNGQTDFARSWTGSPNPDPTPPSGAAYGMDTSNTAAVSATEGIAFAWEIFRGGIYSNSNGYGPAQGQAMLHVTLGDKQPIATRKEGLLWGSDKLDVGSMTLFNPGNAPNGGGYIYMYSNSVGTYSPVVVGRVPVASAFDHTQYRFLKTDGTWDAAGTIPNSSADGYGMSGNPQPPVSNAEGSIMYNQYLSKYMLFTSTMETSGGFYLADTPYGPWGQKFEILSEGGHYGMNCHPELLPGSNGQTVLVSWGTSSVQTMYKLSFAY